MRIYRYCLIFAGMRWTGVSHLHGDGILASLARFMGIFVQLCKIRVAYKILYRLNYSSIQKKPNQPFSFPQIIFHSQRFSIEHKTPRLTQRASRPPENFCKRIAKHHFKQTQPTIPTSLHSLNAKTEEMSEATPRITAPYLENFSHQTVRILGKVRQLRGEQATIDAGGSISVFLNRVSHPSPPSLPPSLP